jgi:tetratricopeptide (TPR) repeat protein
MLAIAELFVKDRKFGEAERIVNNALKLFDEISNRYGVARCYLGMGRLRLEAGKYTESLEMFVQANAYFSALECAAGAARVARGKGRALHAIGRPDESWLEYNAALQEYRKVADKLGEAETLLGTGEVLMAMARFPEARNNIQRSKELFDHITRKKGAARALFCMAKLERSKGSDPRRAFEEAARAFRDADDEHGWARSQFEIARYERTIGGAADNIRSRLHKALVTFERLAARREEVQVRIELAEMGATRENLALIEYFLQSYEGPEAERAELQARMAALRPPH